ncbi:hypothetical protein F5Y14DRAFT_462790 [Nemania sp. NC0429]|nr:hypothetical protein F5Y14DRAFT_462790 [Nemania sp. NC0429]
MSSMSFDKLIPIPTEVNDTHRVYSIAIACILLAVLAVAICFLRLVHRFRRRALGPDDYALIPALFLYIGWTVLAVYVNIAAGIGKPLVEITVPEYVVWWKGLVAGAWLYPIMSASIRVSIILFYQRVFSTGVGRLFNRLLWSLLVLQGLYVIAFSITPTFTCHPTYYGWQFYGQAEHCDYRYYNNNTVALYGASLAFDISLLLFPLHPISKLQLPGKRKLGLSAIFALGAGASVATAYKLAIFVAQEPRTMTSNPDWFNYVVSRYIPVQFDSHGVTIWIPSQVEPTLGLIGASLPALHQLFVSAAKELSRRATGRSNTDTFELRERQGAQNTPTGERSAASNRYQKMTDSQEEFQSLTTGHA